MLSCSVIDCMVSPVVTFIPGSKFVADSASIPATKGKDSLFLRQVLANTIGGKEHLSRCILPSFSYRREFPLQDGACCDKCTSSKKNSLIQNLIICKYVQIELIITRLINRQSHPMHTTLRVTPLDLFLTKHAQDGCLRFLEPSDSPNIFLD